MDEIKDLIQQGFEKADCRKPYTNEPYPYFDSQINAIADVLYNAGYRKSDKYKEDIKFLRERLLTQFLIYNEAERLHHTALIETKRKAFKEFAGRLKKTAFRMFPNSNEEFIYAKNVDVLLDKLLKGYEK